MFDLTALQTALTRHGRVARIVVAATEGSAPREAGAAMLVWADGQSGTIGGGTLEWQAVLRARGMLAAGGCVLTREALGPGLGQCCGGAVTLLTEIYDTVPTGFQNGPLIARATAGQPMPLAVKRFLAAARNQGQQPPAQLIGGWMVEPTAPPRRPLWIWGAGHVGRALVDVLRPLPDFDLTWVDIAPDRFPHCSQVRILPVADPADTVTLAPTNARHLIVTFSHSLDLELCHRLLTHGFAGCGLIGSATKWARFRSRLKALDHVPDQIARITCPIGDPALGKHPQAIAIGVASALLVPMQIRQTVRSGRP
ncbi:MAG: xanthine dehydrogenase accessory protein XdhC [Candidatus Saccharibacteria bacterium]|nr:xanthine dehydrogenase accessory protein XdhC [Pseudorhodobacter sp.]